MAKIHFLKCSAPLAIREVQTETNLRFYLILVRMTKIINTWQHLLSRVLVGGQTGATTMETRVAVLSKAENQSASRFNYIAFGHILRGLDILLWGYLLIHVHCWVIHNNPKLETTQHPIKWCMDNENMLHLHNRILFSCY